MINIWNLWIFFVPGFGVMWALMIVANRKRGRPIEDPEFYKLPNGKKCLVLGWIWFIALLLVSLFTPINFGLLFWIALPLFIMGKVLNVIAVYSFAQFTTGVNTSGIYRYSRNPMYVGGLFSLLGLCLMSDLASIMSIIFIGMVISGIVFTHWTVLLEESFLEHKYGEVYLRYKQTVPRYISFKRSIKRR